VPCKKWLQICLSTSKKVTHKKSEYSIHEKENYDEDIRYRGGKVPGKLAPKNTDYLIHANKR